MLVCKDSASSVIHHNEQRGDSDPGLQERAGSLPHSSVSLGEGTAVGGSAPGPGVSHLPGALCWTVTLIRHCRRGKPWPWVTLGTPHGVTGDQPRPGVLLWRGRRQRIAAEGGTRAAEGFAAHTNPRPGQRQQQLFSCYPEPEESPLPLVAFLAAAMSLVLAHTLLALAP